MTSTLSERSLYGYKVEMKRLQLVFDFGALITCAVVGVSLGFAHADFLQLDPERSATIVKTSSAGSERSGTVANFGVGRDIDTLFVIDLRGSKTGGSPWPLDTDGDVRTGFPAAISELAQTGGPVRLPVQTKTRNEPFDCYAAEPRSHDYEVGNYAQAIMEIAPLATEQCPRAAHLLAVMYAKGQGVKQDLVHAYALLLVAFSEGVNSFRRK